MAEVVRLKKAPKRSPFFLAIAYLIAKVGKDKCQRMAPSLINNVENTPARKAVSESWPMRIAIVWNAPPMIQAVA